MKQQIWQRVVLPAIHAVRKEPVASEIARLELMRWWNAAQIEEHQRQRFLRVLGHSVRNIPFYRERVTGTWAPSGEMALNELLAAVPVLEKDDVRTLSQETERHLRSYGRYQVRKTSGSSGNPLTVFVDPLASAQTLAARARFQSWVGVKPGDRECRVWGRPLGGLELVKVKVKDLLLNRYRVSPPELESGLISKKCERIRRTKPDFIYGYPSMIFRLAEYLVSSGEADGFAPKAVVLTAEKSESYERERLSKLLGCPVIDEYGCSEVDIIAHQCAENSYHLNAENILIEVLPNDPADPLRGEIIVTDLNNVLMPIIRYRLGDEIVLRPGHCGCGSPLPMIESVSGRSRFRYFEFSNGRRIHASRFSYFIEELVRAGFDVKQFRVTQRTKTSIVLMLVLARDFPEMRESVKARFANRLGGELGVGVNVDFMFVERIEATPSGKTEYFQPMSNWTDALNDALKPDERKFRSERPV